MIYEASYEAFITSPDSDIEVHVQAFLANDRVEAGELRILSKDTGKPVKAFAITQLQQVRQSLQSVERWLEGINNPYKVQILSMKKVEH